LGEAFERAALVGPERGCTHVADLTGDVRQQSYLQLFEDAQRIGGGMRALGMRPGDRAILQLDQPSDLVGLFWACTLGGFVPMPVPPVYNGSALDRLRYAWNLLGRPIIVRGDTRSEAAPPLGEEPDLTGLRAISVSELRERERVIARHSARPSDNALLMLTSGSTGAPKVVPLSHENLLAQAAGSAAMLGLSIEDHSLNWMPLEHIGSLAMFHIRDAIIGCDQVVVETSCILEDPLRWLDLIDQYRITISWAPHFAYGLVTERVRQEPLRSWNLSSMRILINAGEMVVPRTVRRFVAALQPYGLSPSALCPAWGMTETSSAVVYSRQVRTDVTVDDAFVSSYVPIAGTSVRIVDDYGTVANQGTVGRLQVRGSSVTTGYLEDSARNREAFAADGWFETGDLGSIRDGRLSITGRRKDVIIVNGTNYSASDIEAAAEMVEGLAPSYTAACAVRDPDAETDSVALFFHPIAGDDEALVRTIRRLAQEIGASVGVQPRYYVPVRRDEVPKTAIGKIERAKIANQFRAGAFTETIKRVDVALENAHTIPDWFYQRSWKQYKLTTLTPERSRRPVVLFSHGAEAIPGLELACSARDRHCVLVEPGIAFDRIDQGHYRLNPTNAESYDLFFRALASDGLAVNDILHAWTALPATPSESETIDRGRALGVDSLRLMIQALCHRSEPRTVRCVIVSRCSQQTEASEPLSPVRAMVPGLVRSARRELPLLTMRHIDLDGTVDAADGERVLRELETVGDCEVAYRANKRLVPRLTRIDWSGPRRPAPLLRRQGRYVLTGGLGGLGVIIATHLLRDLDARLLLVGRTPLAELGDNKSSLYAGLRALGDVRYEAADVADACRLEEIVARTVADWGGVLDGAVHLAGAFHQRDLIEEDDRSVDAILRSKVAGTHALKEVLDKYPRSALIGFSSATSALGGAGVSTYAMANRFVEAVALSRQQRGIGPSSSLSWSMWDDIGLSHDYPMRALTTARGYAVIGRREGVRSFELALSCPVANVIIGLDDAVPALWSDLAETTASTVLAARAVTRDAAAAASCRGLAVKDRLGILVRCTVTLAESAHRTADGALDRAAVTEPARAGSAVLASDHVLTAVERQILALWKDLLGCERLTVHDNFFAAGGDSLSATRLLARLRDLFQVEVPIRAIFATPTIAGIATVLGQCEREAGRVSAIAELREQIDQLSPNEVKQKLRAALGTRR